MRSRRRFRGSPSNTIPIASRQGSGVRRSRRSRSARRARRPREAEEVRPVAPLRCVRRRGPRSGPGAAGAYGTRGRFDLSDLSSLGGLGDLFSSIFGRRGSGRVEDEDEIEVAVTIPFRWPRWAGGPHRASQTEVCPTCSGSGAAPGATLSTCPECKAKDDLVRAGWLACSGRARGAAARARCRPALSYRSGSGEVTAQSDW